MDSIFKKPAPKTGGFYESAYKLFMRRNSVYVTGSGLWENNNKGKRYEDISVLGQRPVEE
ncbi:hypothetical protein MKW92_000253 [Papaver armeniacum]|nr:hypothetical protein MKW92_000253 [Papaver armeniacum]